jgi:GT2 family glycosyltransferase
MIGTNGKPWAGNGRPEPEAAGFTPVRMLQLDLDEPLPAIRPGLSADGTRYRLATVLVRLHRRPIGTAELELGADVCTPADLAAGVWRALGPAINAHLEADGLPRIGHLDVTGLGTAPCASWIDVPDPPLVSVVVPTRDRPERIVRCLDTILASSYPRLEILVVDNAPSSPATADAVRTRYGDRPQVRYVLEPEPGSSNARNRGMIEASGEILAFTDDDVLVDPFWVTALVGGFGAAPGVDCVTGLILPAELETPAQLWLEQYGGYSKGYERRVFDLVEHRAPSPLYPFTPGAFGAGANMSFRTSALRALGGFDAALGNGTRAKGGADIEALLKVVLHGGTLVYEPAAIVHHHHHRDYEALRRLVHSYGVGLTAVLTKCMLDDPATTVQILRRLPRGLHFMLSPGSTKNAKKQDGYPSELTWREVRGAFAGPGAYLLTRFETRRRAAASPALPAPAAGGIPRSPAYGVRPLPRPQSTTSLRAWGARALPARLRSDDKGSSR